MCHPSTLSGPTTDRPSSPSATVLVVDNEPCVLHMMARTLLLAGYAVHMAGSGLEAINIAEDLPAPPNLVVTDLRMEPVGGSELAQQLFSRGLASRFLFVSGYGPDPSYNADFGPCLAKPFSPEKLVTAVESVLAWA